MYKKLLSAILLSFCSMTFTKGQALVNEAWHPTEYTRKGIIPESHYQEDTLKAFFDENWEKSRNIGCYYYTVAYRVNESWVAEDYDVFTKRMIQYAVYADKKLTQRNGLQVKFYPNGEIMTSGIYKGDKKQGIWIYGDQKGKVVDSVVYGENVPIGKSRRYYPSGKLQAAMEFDPSKPFRCKYTAYYENGNIKRTGAYSRFPEVRDSVWITYHPDGSIAYEGRCRDGSWYSISCSDSMGISNDTCVIFSPALFDKGKSTFQQFCDRYLQWPRGYTLGRNNEASVKVQFTVTAEGKVEDIDILQHLSVEFDMQALKCLKKMPAWKPAVEFGEAIATKYKLSLHFWHRR